MSRFSDILVSHGLKQHVNFPTHQGGNILDLIITTNECQLIQNIEPGESLSDHCSVVLNIGTNTTTDTSSDKISYRKYSDIDIGNFKADLFGTDLITSPKTSSADLYDQYHSTLTNLLDIHAPLKTAKHSNRPRNPWITEEIKSAKRLKRQLERRWRQSRSAYDKSRFNHQSNYCNKLFLKAKGDWYTKLVDENKDNPRKLWNSVNKVLHRTAGTVLPDTTSSLNLANKLASFFSEKISKIMVKFDNSDEMRSSISQLQDDPHHSPTEFNHFKPVSENDVIKLISSSPNKQCDLDPCPTSLIKSCVDVLAKPITNIINLSLSDGSFPSNLKQAHVTPLLKKPSLSRNEFKNYRPVSGLNFVSKLLEKVVAMQIKQHLISSSLDNPNQSAYKSGHSTETTLLRVQNDVLQEMDKGNVTALTLLDMSAAFDTIDHNLILERLSTRYGFGDMALKWFRSYLTFRVQKVKVHNTLSDSVGLPVGVPQGSVLGPLLFTMYTAPLSDLINNFPVKHQLYADDTQIYMSFSIKNVTSAISSLQSCLSKVQAWMFVNKLKLNPDKTEFLLLGNNIQRAKFTHCFPVSLMGNPTSPTSSAKNLGVVIDENFDLKTHIQNVCNNCFYHIRDLKRIRKHLNLSTATSLANALVSSRLDYCNSLYYAVSDTYITKLQRVQNCLARAVTMAPRLSESKPLLDSLHWLPIKSRIHFKLGLLVYKAFVLGYPSYLASLLKPRIYGRELKAYDTSSIMPGARSNSNYGEKSFLRSAPFIWNEFPSNVKCAASIMVFRKHLKTHLFQKPP